MKKETIENIFRSSNNSDELFDAFRSALAQGFDDIQLYRILLGNPTLREDEISMYTEKLCDQFSDDKFDFYMWTAEIFQTKSFKIELLESALHYYAKAASVKPFDHIPYSEAINLYNYDLDYSLNKVILDFIINGIESVEKKTTLYKILADHYKKIDDTESHKKYLRLFEKAQKGEN